MKKYTCSKCKGEGFMRGDIETIEVVVHGQKFNHPGMFNHTQCDVCKGEGKLNWIENVFTEKMKDSENGI
jgi:DnaJ-class molecular chaperone